MIQSYFLENLEIGNKISNISIFLELLGLNTQLLDRNFYNFAANFDLPNEHLYDFEAIKTFQTKEIKSQIQIKNVKRKFFLPINGKNYGFYEIKRIGKGGYGEVFLYSYGNIFYENSLFAVKFMEFNTKNEIIRTNIMRSILGDSLILTGMEHENIVKGYFYFKIRFNSTDYFCNLMEYCNGETLESYIQEKKKENEFLSENEILIIFLQILKGLQYARNLFISKKNSELLMHRDLKPENIFIHQVGKRKIIKIGDFGLAKIFIWKTRPELSRESTKDYQSPEMSDGQLSDKCDIWSLGVILYYRCFYEFPWGYKKLPVETYNAQKSLLQHKELQFFGKKREISVEMQNLLRLMIQYNESKRIGFDKIFKNDLFRAELEKDQIKYQNKGLNSDKLVKSENVMKKGFSLPEQYNVAVKNPPQLKSELKNRRIDDKFSSILDLVKQNQKKFNIVEFQEDEEDDSIQIYDKSDAFLITEDFDINGKIPELREDIEEEEEKNEKEKSKSNENDKKPKISDEAFEKIKLMLKKTKNKLFFLNFFDDNLKKFNETHINNIKIENLSVLRIFIQKLKIVIILSNIRGIDIKPDIGGIWRIKNELKEFLNVNNDTRKEFIELLDDTIEKYKTLQDVILNEIITCDNEKSKFFGKYMEINEILQLLNPNIDDWDVYLKDFTRALNVNLDKFNDYIKKTVMINDFEKMSQQEQDLFREIIMIYKNFCVLVNIHKIFEEMREENALGFDMEKLKYNDKIKLQRILNKLGFLQ